MVSVMVTSLPRPLPAGLDVSELFREPLTRRAARERPELAGKVRLVVVAAGHCEIGKRGRLPGSDTALQQSAGAVEANDPGGGLGREPGLGLEAAAEVPRTPPDFRRKAGHWTRCRRC